MATKNIISEPRTNKRAQKAVKQLLATVDRVIEAAEAARQARDNLLGNTVNPCRRCGRACVQAGGSLYCVRCDRAALAAVLRRATEDGRA